MTTTPASATGSALRPEPRDLLRALVAGTSTVVGAAFLRSLVRHVAVAFSADLAFIAERLDDTGERARMMAVWADDRINLHEGHDFSLSGTPCEMTRARDVVLADGVQVAFPQDRVICDHGLDAYLAVTLRGSAGEVLGHLGVASATPLDPSEDELAVLQVFASRAAAEIERRRHEVALRERDADAAALRARVVHAADEERRRIGRDLHDGAQQRLVVLGQHLDLARRRLVDDPTVAAAMLDEARDQARATGEELRELARGLHPAGLSELGLGPALADLARRSPVTLHIDALPDRRMPDVVEVTLYALVSEALSNAMKYADAESVRFAVDVRASVLVAEARDDGCGGADPRRGTGLRGLADRVGALGGTLEIESPPGHGTLLRARIPTKAWRTAREPYIEFGYEGDGGVGEQVIADVLSGHKTAIISLAREWELEGGMPGIGQRLPVLDWAGRRHAIVEITRTSVIPFAEIGGDVAAAANRHVEGVDAWRASQRSYYEGCRDYVAALLGEAGWRLADEEPMAILWFRVV